MQEMPHLLSCEELPSANWGNCTSSKVQEFIAANLRYPEEAMCRNLAETLVVRFVVNRNGCLDNIEIVKGNPHYGFGEEAQRLVQALPPWNPGKQGGVPVRTYFNLPIDFEL